MPTERLRFGAVPWECAGGVVAISKNAPEANPGPARDVVEDRLRRRIGLEVTARYGLLVVDDRDVVGRSGADSGRGCETKLV